MKKVALVVGTVIVIPTLVVAGIGAVCWEFTKWWLDEIVLDDIARHEGEYGPDA